ncbi:MAG: hypothetical protein FJ387_01980 [Verrucomicrobia bacterium]|nr:hypothetical protein [Verrucomicrobiota bacterium]
MKIMTTRRGTLAATWVLLVALTAGCAWSVGGKRGDAPAPPTRGQELIDLKRALDAGAISPTEYDQQKQRLLGR